MLYTTIARLDEEDIAPLREWLAALPGRREELRASYRQAGTRHEQFFLIHTRGGPVLVLVTEVADAEEAARSFLVSNLPIDVEFKALVQEIGPEEADVDLIYDSAGYFATDTVDAIDEG